MKQHYTNPTRKAMTAAISSFLADFTPLRTQEPTPENKDTAAAILAHYVGRLQMIDLTLSQQDARAMLKAAYTNRGA